MQLKDSTNSHIYSVLNECFTTVGIRLKHSKFEVYAKTKEAFNSVEETEHARLTRSMLLQSQRLYDFPAYKIVTCINPHSFML